MQDEALQRLEEELDPEGIAGLLGLSSSTLVTALGLNVLHVNDDELRAEMEALVQALKGALTREMVRLTEQVALLDAELTELTEAIAGDAKDDEER